MTSQNTEQPVDENKIIAERRAKLAEWRKTGHAYPNNFSRDALSGELHEKFGSKTAEELEAAPQTFTIAGRMMLKRVMGKASFATLQDMAGRIQLFISRDAIGEENYTLFKHWDIGDILGATGALFKTKTGELTLRVSSLRLLSKSLRPLPEKFHGLTDQEQKYRQRYVDLIMNQESRDVFIKRSRILQGVREFFVERGFLEVETPMMHPIPGGATAKPFVTHHNALDADFYLRIAPELYLKRLIVGGFERVFEINRSFRNEGIDTRHNPEFTMLEFYEAYRDFHYLMDLTETLLRGLAQEILGSTTVQYQGETIDLSKPFARFTMAEAIHHYHPEHSLDALSDPVYLRQSLSKMKIETREGDGAGVLQMKLFEATTEELLVQPTFIYAHPKDVSPLARANDENPDITDRFELYIVRRELANGFSELNDPEDQARRFHAQVEARNAGDDEAMYYDDDYVRALEFGMPPTAGEGIGIDRLVMFLADCASIRDVLLFPQMKRE